MTESFSVISAEISENLCKKKIFFGHQSVGSNIINGISTLVSSSPATQLHLKETRDPIDFGQPVFAHYKIGKNRDPVGKIHEFSELIAGEIGSVLDVAFLKLCYADVTVNTDPEALFETYQTSMDRVQAIYPDLKIIHWTVPLTSSRITWKTKVKNLLGKRLWECEDNIQRNFYNNLLREKYSAQGVLFDLAALESGIKEKKPTHFYLNGNLIETLYPGYTDDGGHLSGPGQRIIAEQLILFLSTL